MKLRYRTVCALALLVAAAVAAVAAPEASAKRYRSAAWHRIVVNRQRAIASYAALQREYYIRKEGLYKIKRFANAWPYSQALAATISVAAMPGLRGRYRKDVRARLRGLDAYADRDDPPPAGYFSKVAPPRGPGGPRYNDDNEWFGIELLRAHHVARMPTLDKAKLVFGMLAATWDKRTNVPCPGGIPQAPHVNGDRNTVSNAPAAELGAQLYLRTRNPAFLQAAQQMYAWVRGCLLNSDGLYADHIDRHRRIDRTEWTYNQGAMIGAGVMLHEATHDHSYLDQAVATAKAALRAFGPAQLALQPIYFNSIYMRNLLLLGAATRDSRYRFVADRFAADEWNRHRDRHGLFMADPRGDLQLLDQAGMVQIYALLTVRPRKYF